MDTYNFLHYYKILRRRGDRHIVGLFPSAPGYEAMSLIVFAALD